jgi:hypothetical protein
LGTALKESPLKPHPEYYRLYLILGSLWGAGLKDMTVEERWDFCYELEIYSGDFGAYKKFDQRFRDNL